MALQIGHRRSYDFDVFTFESLKPLLWKQIRKIFGAGWVRTLDIQDQINLVTPTGISLTFFYDDYKFLFKPIKTDHLDLMDPRDLSTTKAVAIGRRGKWRDYVDIYFLLKNNIVTLEQIIEFSEKRTGSEFPTRLFLQQLVYFDDITDYKIDFIDKEILPEEIKNFLIQETKKIRF